ncbi:MAG TPA: GspE/PulE family protein [Patescibacteria group bacterium]|nr:GspE/PulE family protein [Patescibacteria group bacterium]
MLSDEQIKAIVTNAKLVAPEQLADVESYSRTAGHSLQDSLVEKEMTTDEALGKFIADSLKVPFVVLSKLQIPQDIFTLVPQRVARKYKMIAFQRSDKGISIALVDPTKLDEVAMIERKTGQKVAVYYATPRDIENELRLYKRDIQRTIDVLIKEDMGGDGLNDPPVAKIVDTLIEFAYEDRASDIHMEPQEKDAIVRFRIDGVLQDVLSITNYLHDRMVTRIKVLSSLRTDEHLSAQDGKLQIPLADEDLDVRVSIVPVVTGEKIVMRLLSSRSRQYSLADLGMNEKDLAKVTNAYGHSFGMILSTGPTGSGKTTSIYAMLKTLNERERNITTIEDPVEYRIKGANQIQVNVKTNLTFANGLRSILRQDPNIIFVGEIRDGETAGIAVNAALTGHLVFSTLHTNDAATTIPRLIDMKVEPFLVASTVNIIIAQRLVRRICNMCRLSTTITEDELLKYLPTNVIAKHYIPIGEKKEIRIYHGKGCKSCNFTGYTGRLGLFEVLEVTKPIRELIIAHAGADAIADMAIKEGMTTMLDDGLQKVAQGVTTIEEILRVTKTEFV